MGKLSIMFKYLFTIVFVLSGVAFQAHANPVKFHVMANIASYHLGASTEFNEVNPGIAIGVSRVIGQKTSWELGGEIGFYNNSYNEITRYALANADFRLSRISPSSEIRAGAFLGLFEYPTVINYANDRGIPTIGNFIMVPGIAAMVRFDSGYDFRVKVAPGGAKSDAIFSLQFVRTF